MKILIRRILKHQYLPYLFITLGIVLGITSAIFYWRQKITEPQPPAGALESKAAPSSAKPSAVQVANYTVAPGLPKYIDIPSIGVNTAKVVRLGVMSNGQIANPNNIYDTGWYINSAKPGQPGAMFIFGHISSWTANGVFYNLKSLKPGADVYIIRGDNKRFVYQVVKSVVYPYNKVDMNTVLSPVVPNIPGLNLMSCTGQIIKGTSEFNERLVVYTKLVNQ